MLPPRPYDVAQELGTIFANVIRESCMEYHDVLIKAIPKEKLGSLMETALDELSNVAKRKPDYDNFALPLFYVSWFQLKHIRMCYEFLEGKQVQFPWDEQRRNTISDIGCGAFAMLWGIIFHFAYQRACQGDRIQTPQIHVRMFDTSEPLLTMGKLMYRNLKNHARQRTSDVLKALNDIIEAIEVNQLDDIDAFFSFDDSEVNLVTGIHVFYENSDEFHDRIADCLNQVDYGLFSYDNASIRSAGSARARSIKRFVDGIAQGGNWIEIGLNTPSSIADNWYDVDTDSLLELRRELGEKYGLMATRGRLIDGPEPIPVKSGRFKYHYFLPKR